MPFWLIVVLLILFIFVFDAFCVSIYLHRCIAHCSIELNKYLASAIRIWLWLKGQTMRAWAAVHRKHHMHPDKPGDPHSPHEHGVWKIVFANSVPYAKAANDEELVEEYAKDVPKNAILDNSLLGIAIGFFLSCTIFYLAIGGWTGVIYGAIFYPVHLYTYMLMGGLINGICHKYGYQNFKDSPNNKATNVPLLGWLIAGEGWHNNHHHMPASPKLSYLKSEFDPGWLVIKILILLRLAKQICLTINKSEELKKNMEESRV